MLSQNQKQPTKTYDLIVLGGGSGGLAGAKRAALLGARVLLIESRAIGGTCVLRGCIPKKIMANAAHLGHLFTNAASYGWENHSSVHNWSTLCANRDTLLERLESMHTEQLKKAGIDVIMGEAFFHDPHTIETSSQQRFMGTHILIATGGHPILPKISGIEHALDSDAFFQLRTRPKSTLIYGGGYIAAEFGSMLHALGTHVTLVARSSLLKHFDTAIRTQLATSFTQQGIHIREHASIESITRQSNGLFTVVGQHQEHTFTSEIENCVVFATGRRPNTEKLQLDAIGLKPKTNGAIEVNEQYQTIQPHIYAVGDVLDQENLTPVAIRAAREVAENLFGKKTLSSQTMPAPTAVFTYPPIGSIGLTEEETQKKFPQDYKVFESSFSPLFYSIVPQDQKQRTYMKLIVQKTTDIILGMHMIGDDAPEIIQGFAVCIANQMTKSQLDRTIALHPTSAEEFVLMR